MGRGASSPSRVLDCQRRREGQVTSLCIAWPCACGESRGGEVRQHICALPGRVVAVVACVDERTPGGKGQLGRALVPFSVKRHTGEDVLHIVSGVGGLDRGARSQKMHFGVAHAYRDGEGMRERRNGHLCPILTRGRAMCQRRCVVCRLLLAREWKGWGNVTWPQSGRGERRTGRWCPVLTCGQAMRWRR